MKNESNIEESAEAKTLDLVCNKCQKPIGPGKEYQYKAKVFCEDCCIAIRTPLVRKTHWQYIGSIKGSYLIHSIKKATKH